ncbi:hypothetical protein AVEN_19986-1 [Araneus ventricosus]|uniref:Uncharacterized protein n=1 Tax=Araneus ventricosus TaxID=182803 RepID=A0A4Y2CE56_ARAVE|nr:hypothetical protein AVEN_19986-1 [Araneus ventricosus]
MQSISRLPEFNTKLVPSPSITATYGPPGTPYPVRTGGSPPAGGGYSLNTLTKRAPQISFFDFISLSQFKMLQPLVVCEKPHQYRPGTVALRELSSSNT